MLSIAIGYSLYYCRAVIVNRSGKRWSENVPGDVLTAIHTGDTEDCERVSTGSKFALEEWLQRTSTQHQ